MYTHIDTGNRLRPCWYADTSFSFQLWEVVYRCPYRKEVYLKHPKWKGNISIEKGIRSKVKCISSAHFPSIWEVHPHFVNKKCAPPLMSLMKAKIKDKFPHYFQYFIWLETKSTESKYKKYHSFSSGKQCITVWTLHVLVVIHVVSIYHCARIFNLHRHSVLLDEDFAL